MAQLRAARSALRVARTTGQSHGHCISRSYRYIECVQPISRARPRRRHVRGQVCVREFCRFTLCSDVDTRPVGHREKCETNRLTIRIGAWVCAIRDTVHVQVRHAFTPTTDKSSTRQLLRKVRDRVSQNMFGLCVCWPICEAKPGYNMTRTCSNQLVGIDFITTVPELRVEWRTGPYLGQVYGRKGFRLGFEAVPSNQFLPPPLRNESMLRVPCLSV
jgi:hypothetical protein